jgi:adenosylcobinamide-GDP ribazoletransferase
MVAMVLLNGVMHLDGFMDTCDGLAGNKTAEDRWRVMRDSRVGAFAVAGAVLLMLVKYTALASLPDRLIPGVLLLMALLSRWAMAYAIVAFPYARPEGLGTVFKKEAKAASLVVATLYTVAAAIGAAVFMRMEYPHGYGLAIGLGVWLVVSLWAIYLKKRFAGLTGDSYGAVNEVAEVSVIILVSILAHNGWLGATSS